MFLLDVAKCKKKREKETFRSRLRIFCSCQGHFAMLRDAEPIPYGARIAVKEPPRGQLSLLPSTLSRCELRAGNGEQELQQNLDSGYREGSHDYAYASDSPPSHVASIPGRGT